MSAVQPFAWVATGGWPASPLVAHAAPLEGLDTHLALRFKSVLGVEECSQYASQVLAARADWVSNFSGAQFTLGRAWYTHLEEDRADEYFANVASSDMTVRTTTPGLQEAVLALAGAVVGAPVTQRKGWCGPGVHVFRPGSEVARRGGEVHFDTEGLTEAQLGRRAPALTFILMLQPAEIGGGLRVWDRLYDGEDFPDKPDPRVGVTQIAYEVGELVVIDSYRLHQILPFRGDLCRITATMHVALEGATWEGWF